MKKRILITCVLLLAGMANAQTFYVDAVNGSDSYTSTQAQNINTPWKTISKSIGYLGSGDIVNVRGGTYQEQVTLTKWGSSGNPITFQAYNGEAVKLAGTVDVTDWTVCTSSEAGLTVGGITNPNYASIYKATVATTSLPSSIWNIRLYEDSDSLWPARDPDQTTALDVDTRYSLPVASHNLTHIIDDTGSRPTNKVDNFWTGALCEIQQFSNNNFMTEHIVASSDQGDTSITMTLAISPTLYVTANHIDSYAMRNHPHILDKAGEFYISDVVDSARTIYVWPLDTASLAADMSISSNTSNGFYRRGTSGFYYTFDGFEVYGYSGAGFYMVAPSAGSYAREVTIKNCDIYDCGGIGIQFQYAEDCNVTDCTIERVGSYGVRMTYGSNSYIQNCEITDSKGSGISFVDMDDSYVLNNNVFSVTGTHADGMSIYPNPDGCDRVLIAYNYFNGTAPTFNTLGDCVLFANVMPDRGYKIEFFSATRVGAKILFLNNTLPQGFGIHDNGTYYFRNNLIDYWETNNKGTITEHTYNIYTAAPGPSTWDYGTTEALIDDADMSTFFYDVDDTTRDGYEIILGSPMIGAGSPITDILTTAGVIDTVTPANDWFPDFDWDLDAKGNIWNETTPSIGAIEYSGLIGDPDPGNVDPVLQTIGNQEVYAWETISITPVATDEDDNDLSYIWRNVQPNSMHLSFDGKDMTWPTTYADSQVDSGSGAGIYSYTCEVSDGRGGTDEETITITINARHGYVLPY